MEILAGLAAVCMIAFFVWAFLPAQAGKKEQKHNGILLGNGKVLYGRKTISIAEAKKLKLHLAYEQEKKERKSGFFMNIRSDRR